MSSKKPEQCLWKNVVMLCNDSGKEKKEGEKVHKLEGASRIEEQANQKNKRYKGTKKCFLIRRCMKKQHVILQILEAAAAMIFAQYSFACQP